MPVSRGRSAPAPGTMDSSPASSTSLRGGCCAPRPGPSRRRTWASGWTWPGCRRHLNMSELALVLLQRLLARARAGFVGSSHSEDQYHQRHRRIYHRPGGAVDSGQAV